ncbi:hypothetical protein ABCR94_26165 [Streptomyces sp. 21So2-11]|uniref:hypothetical protein n=1 Tax=Streptomyces sp. 21So2-11 TaxID=3144408 RepID=UPI003219376F
MNIIRTAVVTAAAVGMTIVSLGSATAAAPAASAAPKFLSASQLPAASPAWVAGAVKQGLPASQSPCTAGSVPKAGTKYRDFRTDLDTGARQTITVAATEAKAKALAAKIRTSITGCLHRLQMADPGLEGEAFYHGKVNVAAGAHIHSLDTNSPEVGTVDINLFAIGRDGKAVTVVQWGQMGSLDAAPLAGFKKTAGVAVGKLY